MKGFYIPAYGSGSYVASKRDEAGNLIYDSAVNEIGLSAQKGIQTLESNYAQAIENAYSSYLAANRGILGSQMGQGYKEAYLENQRQQFQQAIAQTNLSAAQARQELTNETISATDQIAQAFQTEVSNFDRVQRSMNDYLSYVKTLTSDDGASTYLSEEYANLGVDELYNVLFEAQPQGFKDVSGNTGMSFLEWIDSKLTTGETDEAYRNWLYNQGGYQEARTQLSAKSLEAQQARREKLAQAEAALTEYKKGNYILGEETTKNKTGDFTYDIDGKSYILGKRLNLEGNLVNLDNELTEFYKKSTGKSAVESDQVIHYNGAYYHSYRASNMSPVHWAKLDAVDGNKEFTTITKNNVQISNRNITINGQIYKQSTGTDSSTQNLLINLYKDENGKLPSSNSVIRYDGLYYIYCPMGSKKAARKAGRSGTWYQLIK